MTEYQATIRSSWIIDEKGRGQIDHDYSGNLGLFSEFDYKSGLAEKLSQLHREIMSKDHDAGVLTSKINLSSGTINSILTEIERR